MNRRHLSLSTNCIDKMISLPALKNIEVLSLGRNLIKKISGLEEIGSTLRELWISYNQITTLDGLAPCVKLTTLFISNNKIKDWPELDKLQANQDLVNVLLYGNPIYEGLSKKQARPKVLEHLPKIATLDGELLTGDDDDGAFGKVGNHQNRERRVRSEVIASNLKVGVPMVPRETPPLAKLIGCRSKLVDPFMTGGFGGSHLLGDEPRHGAMKPQAPKHRKKGARGRSSGRHEKTERSPEPEEPPWGQPSRKPCLVRPRRDLRVTPSAADAEAAAEGRAEGES
eukprot:s3670_g2.t1